MKEGWKMVKLGDICEKIKNIKWTENSLSFQYIDLTSVDRETDTILATQIINSKDAPSRAKQIIKEGDVLFATTRPTLKRICRIPHNYQNSICSTGFCVLRPLEEVDSNWM